MPNTANWAGMEQALKTYFEDTDKPNDMSFIAIGNKIATEYKNAVSTATDDVGNPVINASGLMTIGPVLAAEFAAQRTGAQPNFGPVVTAVTAANLTLVLGFNIPNPSSTPPGMTIGVSAAMVSGGSGNVSKYKQAFGMQEGRTAAETAKDITDAMKQHFSGNTTTHAGTIPGSPPIACVATSKMS